MVRVWMEARCGHRLLVEPACENEPNPPMAWCDPCDDWRFFDGARYEYEVGRGVVLHITQVPSIGAAAIEERAEEA